MSVALGRPPPTSASDEEWANFVAEFAKWESQSADSSLPQPQMVAPGVFLGGLHEAKDVASLQERGVDCVLCLAPRECGTAESRYPKHWTTLDLEAEDELGYDIFQDDVPRAFQFIERCLGECRAVFVHCVAGMNRSATVCAAWILRSQGWPLTKTVQHLAMHRGLVLQNPSFNEGLVAMARAEEKLGEGPRDLDDY